MSLLSYAYTDEMIFAPLQTLMCESDPVKGAEVQQHWSCSPRSMYSLATAVGVSSRYITLSADMSKAWNPRRQGACFQGHPIQTLHRQHRTGNVYFLRCKVGIYRLCSFVSSHLDPSVTKWSWIWKSSSSTKTSLRKTPSHSWGTSELWRPEKLRSLLEH